MNVTDWSAQNPEINPTDNLWVKLRPRSEPEDHQGRFAREKWAGNVEQTCVRLVENYNKLLQEVRWGVHNFNHGFCFFVKNCVTLCTK